MGSLGFHHARVLKDLDAVELVGFVDSRAERAREVSASLGIRSFTALDTMLDAVDAVTIAVPTPAHHEVALQALERGKHVLIEKPITTTLAQADELLAAAKRSGALIQTGHIERFNRAIRAALPHVEQARFVQSDRLAPFNVRGSDVAVVLDLMIHDIDLILTLVRDDAKEVTAVGVPVLTPTVDIANARLVFAGGAVASITASRISRERTRKIRIFEPRGYLSLDLAAGDGEFYRLRDDFDAAAVASGARQPFDFIEHIKLEAPEGEPLRLEMESFAAALLGETEPAVTGEDGRRALDVALRIVAEIERTLPALRGVGH